MMSLPRAATFAAVLLILGGCQTVPLTGRQQLMMLDADTETKLGYQSFRQIKKEMVQVKDEALTRRVRAVAMRIAEVSGLTNVQWEIAVFDDDTPNAFALPGGKIGVHTGILLICQDDAGLATVLGHEVGHVMARHGAERVSQQQLLQAGVGIASAALGGNDPASQQAVGALLGAGATYGVVLPFSRDHELEADRIGLVLMARAGYDPRHAIGFWQRMAKASAGKDKQPEFFSTHPADDTRILQIQSLMPEAMANYKPR